MDLSPNPSLISSVVVMDTEESAPTTSPLHEIVLRLVDVLFPNGMALIYTPEELADRGVDVDMLVLVVKRLEE